MESLHAVGVSTPATSDEMDHLYPTGMPQVVPELGRMPVCYIDAGDMARYQQKRIDAETSGMTVATCHIFASSSRRSHPVQKRTTTLFRPPPVKSANAMPKGTPPVAIVDCAVKVPSPLPLRRETVLSYWLTTARSGIPSALRSAAMSATGPEPTASASSAASGERECCWKSNAVDSSRIQE